MCGYPMPTWLLFIFISSSVCCSFCLQCACCCCCCCQRHYYHYDYYQQELQQDKQRGGSRGSSSASSRRKLQRAKRSVHIASRLVWFSVALCFRVLITIIKQRSGLSRLLWCLLPAARPGQRNNNERSAATEPWVRGGPGESRGEAHAKMADHCTIMWCVSCCCFCSCCLISVFSLSLSFSVLHFSSLLCIILMIMLIMTF